MRTIEGVCTFAKIFADGIDDYALAQIKMLCDNEAFMESKIRVMPDVHPGKVGTIGFTSTIGRKILPNVVGIDIGCGVTIAKSRQKKIEFQKLDTVIRENIPSGFQVRKKPHRFSMDFDFSGLNCERHINKNKALLSLGTLGGGNHFIEVGKDDEGYLYVVIHSGSRHLGKEVTEYYLKSGQEYLKSRNIAIPYELTFLEGELMEAYIHDMQIVQEFASLNRKTILDELVKGMKLKIEESYSSVHNYIDASGEEMILRKGAISAKKGEKVVIPINMRDGVILGTGLGNQDWNFSAPHGAGRIMKREDVKQKYTVSQFKTAMKGIYCTVVNKDTLDESPFAYRELKDIEDAVSETVKINNIIKPVYNFKAGGR
ncbi:MAG: RtcB family protein [Lachnospiraceae bacterium]|nr:RtcB family protein [Lachnospiraceae bacterium]